MSSFSFLNSTDCSANCKQPAVVDESESAGFVARGSQAVSHSRIRMREKNRDSNYIHVSIYFAEFSSKALVFRQVCNSLICFLATFSVLEFTE